METLNPSDQEGWGRCEKVGSIGSRITSRDKRERHGSTAGGTTQCPPACNTGAATGTGPGCTPAHLRQDDVGDAGLNHPPVLQVVQLHAPLYCSATL